MTTQSPATFTATAHSLAQRLWNGLRRDWTGLVASFAPPEPPKPGMYTYCFQPPGGQRRIHLRIEADGSGVMFIDVTDVIHLNPTAAAMVPTNSMPRPRRSQNNRKPTSTAPR